MIASVKQSINFMRWWWWWWWRKNEKSSSIDRNWCIQSAQPHINNKEIPFGYDLLFEMKWIFDEFVAKSRFIFINLATLRFRPMCTNVNSFNWSPIHELNVDLAQSSLPSWPVKWAISLLHVELVYIFDFTAGCDKTHRTSPCWICAFGGIRIV